MFLDVTFKLWIVEAGTFFIDLMKISLVLNKYEIIMI